HSLGERDRQHLLRAEAHGVAQKLLVLDARDLEHAHTDAVARDTQADALLRQLVLLEEETQRSGERLRVTQLAGDDDAALERHARHLQELVVTVRLYVRSRDLRRADAQADNLLRAARALARLHARLLLFLGLALLAAVRVLVDGGH